MEDVKGQIVRIAGASAVALAVVLVIPLAKRLGEDREPKVDNPIAFEKELEIMDMKVDGMNQMIAQKKDEIDWSFHEQLDVQRVRVVPIPIELVEEDGEVVELAPEVAPPVVSPTLAERVAALTLTGIAWSDTQPLAFIGGKVLRINDEIEGLMVVEIQPASIRLMDTKGALTRIVLYER
ncbi:MAG: hypothetical protein ACI9TH_002536 [Kiritimatiellia bacterium]|jgi:hypothetical protein